MNVLVINSGSSSLKYQLIDVSEKKVLAKGLCDRIGLDGSVIKHNAIDKGHKVFDAELKNHSIAIEMVLKILMDKDVGVISSSDEIAAVGHRVVHGGEKFHDSVIIKDSVKKAIRDCFELAPLHNPANLTGIEACEEIMPDKPMVAVFDTAFHQTMPAYAYLYALPYEIYEKYGIRKYGFHGTSHRYVSERASALLGIPLSKLKIISCHLGNGASICAIKYGKSVETSMGFTPLDGLAMGTRSGTIDPSIMSFLMKKENMSIEEINDYLNKRSGVLGISGVSSDFRDVMAAAKEGNRRASLAIKIFCYRVKNYIAEYAGVMNGVDVVIFTAGIGENNGIIRRIIVSKLGYLGIAIDAAKNKVQGKEMDITREGARVKTLVIPTNEELMIAKETVRLLFNN
jgi:acetate kinase